MEQYLFRACKKIFRLEAYNYEVVDRLLESLTDQELKHSILEDFTHINDLGEKMMNILVKAVDRFGIKTTGEETKQDLAMHLFMDHRDAFDYAYDFYCLFNASSKTSYHNLPHCDFVITRGKMDRFKQRIIEFYSRLKKGHECIVRYYDEADQAVIVVIHGSYRRSVSTWQKGDLDTIFFRPAKEDILQFDKKLSVLSIKAPYRKDKINYINAFT